MAVNNRITMLGTEIKLLQQRMAEGEQGLQKYVTQLEVLQRTQVGMGSMEFSMNFEKITQSINSASVASDKLANSLGRIASAKTKIAANPLGLDVPHPGVVGKTRVPIGVPSPSTPFGQIDPSSTNADELARKVALEKELLLGEQQYITALHGEALALDVLIAKEKERIVLKNQGIVNASKQRAAGGFRSEADRLVKEDLAKVNAEIANSGNVFQRFWRRLRGGKKPLNELSEGINKTEKSSKSFGKTILKNMGSFIGWSIAMSLVMIPLRLISDGVRDMMDAQEELAQLSITLGREQDVLTRAYNDVAEAVEGTGIAMNDALDAYAIAVRATAGVTDENERMAKSNELLADSLAFTRLSGMESAEAIDAIAAAMRQWDINDATVLMDVWVKTLDVANVSLESLAEVFANSSESAKGMGVSIEELSAIVGLMSDATTMSGSEISSALESMFGGFTKEGGVLAFADIGKDIRGLGFLEIANELSVLQDRMSTVDFDDFARKLVGQRRIADLKVLLGILEDIPDTLQGIEDSGNTAEEALKNMALSPKSAWQELKNELSEFFFILDEKTEGSDKYVKFLDTLSESVQRLTDRLKDNKKAQDEQSFSDPLAGQGEGSFGVGSLFSQGAGNFLRNLLTSEQVGKIGLLTPTALGTASPEAMRAEAQRIEVEGEEDDDFISPFRGEFVGVGGMFSQEELALISNTVTQEQERIFSEKYGDDPLDTGRNALIASAMEDFSDIVLQGGLGEFQQLGMEADTGTVSRVISLLQESGAISDFAKDKDKLTIKELPFGVGQLDNFQAALDLATREVEKVTGKKVETEEIVVALKDGSLTKVEANQKIMNLVLDQIEENTRDIVRGVFNLPSGADIFVPLAAAENAAGFGKEGSNFEILFREFMAMFETSMESRGAGFVGGFVGTDSTGSAVQAINLHFTNTSFLHLDGAIIAEDTQERTTSRLNRSSGAFGGATRQVMV